MKIEKATLSYQDDIQILLFTDGVMEALETNEADGLVQLSKAVSKKWLTCREDAPIDLVLQSIFRLISQMTCVLS